jgi:hypothetical protein
MARIRTIKPEILEDQKTAQLSHEAFRLFIGMIALADDHGGMRGETAWLEGQVFWACPATDGRSGVETALEELASAELISLYEVRGQRYASIIGWSKHQKVDHPGKPRVPRPDDELAWKIPILNPTKIYFVQAEESRAIRIGLSWNPARRLASIQNGHHEKLTLLCAVVGDIKMERELHRRFAAQRMSGEWFECTHDLIEFIENLSEQNEFREESRKESRELSRDSPRTFATDLGPRTIGPRTEEEDLSCRPRAGEDKKPRAKRRTAMPADWAPNDKHREIASELNLDCDAKAVDFHDHHTAKGSLFADWDAAFRTWLRNAPSFANSRQPRLAIVPPREPVKKL